MDTDVSRLRPPRAAILLRAITLALVTVLALAWASPAEAHCHEGEAAAAFQDGHHPSPDHPARSAGNQPGPATCCFGAACITAALPLAPMITVVIPLPERLSPPLSLGLESPARPDLPAEPPRS
jgi:hypothetical protein